MVCLVRWKWVCILLSSRSVDCKSDEDKICTAEKSRSIQIRWNSTTSIEPKLREVVGRMMIRGMHSVTNLNVPCVENSGRSKKFAKLSPKQDYRDGFLLHRRPANVQIKVWNRTFDSRFFVCHARNWWLGTLITRVWSMAFTESHSAHFLLQYAEFMLCISCGLCSNSFCCRVPTEFFTIVRL